MPLLHKIEYEGDTRYSGNHVVRTSYTNSLLHRITLRKLWLNYLDALESVDTSSAPDIEWPIPPGGQAS